MEPVIRGCYDPRVMNRDSRGRDLRLLTLLAALVLAAAPAFADKPKLSDVAKEAKKPPAEQQPVGATLSESKAKPADPPPTSPPPPVREEAPIPGGVVLQVPEYIGPYPIPAYTAPYPSYVVEASGDAAPSDVQFRAGFTGGGGGLSANMIDRYGGGGLLAGVQAARWTVDARGMRSSARLTGDAAPAFRSFNAWSGDLSLRFRLNDEAARAGANLVVTGRLGRYGWKYANPITITETWGDRVVSRDSLPYRAVLAGLGVEAARSDAWSLWLTAAGGWQHFSGETGEGFENDLFDNRGVFEVMADFVCTLRTETAPDEEYDRPRR